MRRKTTAVTPFILALALAGVPAHAGPTSPSADAASALATAQAAASREDCSAVLSALDPILPGLSDPPTRNVAQRMRLICLARVGRVAELAPVQAELAKALPRDGLVRAFGALIAADENRFPDAAEQIALLAETSPDMLEMITGATVREIASRLSEAKQTLPRDRMLIALSQAAWAPADAPDLGTSVAESAIEALLHRGDAAGAEGLVDRIEAPNTLSAMLVDRQYAPIWPAVERKLGPAGTLAIDSFAREKLAGYADTPDSRVARRDAAHAMMWLGRPQDVIDLTEGIGIASGMSSDEIDMLVLRARALALLRRNDAASDLLAGFLSLDLRANPEATIALISYAEFLDETGRAAKALEIARAVEVKGQGVFSDFGMRWIERTEVCALSALGRPAEAGVALARLVPNANQNPAAAIEALLCAKRDAEASKLAVEALADRDQGSEILYQFQPPASLWGATSSRLRNLWIAFLARPEIRNAFERRGRILPRDYWPGKEPRDIPRRATGSSATLT